MTSSHHRLRFFFVLPSLFASAACWADDYQTGAQTINCTVSGSTVTVSGSNQSGSINTAATIPTSSCNTWELPTATSVSITPAGQTCETVTNNTGKTIFIPTRTALEWSDFTTHAPTSSGGKISVVSCSPTPVNGACGPANGNSYATAAAVISAGLCSSGAASADPSGAGPWSWTCNGANNGSASPPCSATLSAVTNVTEYNFKMCTEEPGGQAAWLVINQGPCPRTVGTTSDGPIAACIASQSVTDMGGGTCQGYFPGVTYVGEVTGLRGRHGAVNLSWTFTGLSSPCPTQITICP